MDQLFFSLKKLFTSEKTITDNFIFRLHYKFTVITLVCFSLLVTGRQYIGSPIHCMPIKDVPEKLLNTFCWINTTFSVEEAWFKIVGQEVPYPGIDNSFSQTNRTLVYHAYYQWVGFVLAMQVLLFYFPRYFWNCVEGGRMKNLVLGLNNPILPDDKRFNFRQLLASYLLNDCNNHNWICSCYVIAEMMNFANVVGQIFLMNRFFGGEFFTYGTNILLFTEWDWTMRYDRLIHIFPRVTKCRFYNFGFGGDIERRETLCILPLNVINEKIFVFLWFWFVILSVLSGLVLFYRFFTLASPATRVSVLHVRCRAVRRQRLADMIASYTFGDWLYLSFMAKNMHSLHFRDLVEEYLQRRDQNLEKIISYSK